MSRKEKAKRKIVLTFHKLLVKLGLLKDYRD